jgi:hypothetical protein
MSDSAAGAPSHEAWSEFWPGLTGPNNVECLTWMVTALVELFPWFEPGQQRGLVIALRHRIFARLLRSHRQHEGRAEADVLRTYHRDIEGLMHHTLGDLLAAFRADEESAPYDPVAVRVPRVIDQLFTAPPTTQGRRPDDEFHDMRLVMLYEEIREELEAKGVGRKRARAARGWNAAQREAIGCIAANHQFPPELVAERLEEWTYTAAQDIAADLVCLRAQMAGRTGHHGQPLTREHFLAHIVPRARRRGADPSRPADRS